MPDQTSTIISKVWGMCGPLRRRVLRRLPGAAYIPDFSENVRRVRKTTLQAGDRYPRRLRLVGHE